MPPGKNRHFNSKFKITKELGGKLELKFDILVGAFQF